MKTKVNLKKFLTGLTASALALTVLVPAGSAFAAPGTNTKVQNDYMFVPAISGSDAAAKLSNESGSAATIGEYNSEDNSVTITFPAGTKAEGEDALTRTATQVNLDTSAVAEHRLKYVSFDLTADDLMDFVASWDKKDARWTLSRPLSLYVTDNGYMQGTFQNRDQHFGTAGTSITQIKNWFADKANSFSVAYEKGKTYNIKMVRDLRDGKSWTYIDGVMHGQDTYTTSITNDESKNWMKEIKEPNFTLTHYATKDTAQSITLKNIEIGDAYENGLVIPKDDFKMGDGKSTVFWTPTNAANNRDSGNVFIRLAMPADKSWHLQAGECKTMWNADKEWGVCNNWAYSTFTGQASTAYSTINGWGNVSCYQYAPSTADTIKVTFEFDRNNKTVKTYTDKGGYYEYAYNDSNFSSYPTNIKLSCDTEAINVETDVAEEYGEVVPIGLNIKNSKEEVVNEFTEGENYYITTCNDFSDTEIVLYAWYDESGVLLKADQRSVSRQTINANTKGLSVRNDFKTTAPQGATMLKAYLWDSTSGLKPLCDAVSVQKAVESAE